MKKYIIILTVLGAGLLASCENFLDRDPKSDLSPNLFWQSESDLVAWNAGMYNGLQAALRTKIHQLGEIRSGIYSPRGTGYDTNLLYRSLNSTHGTANWADLYTVIYRANAAIKYIPGMDISEATKNDYLGQAHTMRALMYFYLIRAWGDVPLITDPLEDPSAQEIEFPRTSIYEIYDFMLEDLATAASLFEPSVDLTTASKYYLNRGAAMALKTDICLWFKDYDEAITAADEVIGNYNYSLASNANYKGQFENPESSNEMIFNIFWDYSEYGNGSGFAQFYASGSNTIQFHPTENIFKLLVERKKEDIRTTIIMDTLWISSYITPYEIELDTYEKAMDRFYNNNNPAEWQIKCPKFTDFSQSANDGIGGYSYMRNDEDNSRRPVYRLADIMLLKAEALALKTPADLQGALDIVNLIRDRAGYTEVATLADYPTQKDVLECVLEERMIELWGEGKHYFDLVRNDLVKEYLDARWALLSDDDDDQVGSRIFDPGVAKPSPDHVSGYGQILWPIYYDAFAKNSLLVQTPPYTE